MKNNIYINYILVHDFIDIFYSLFYLYETKYNIFIYIINMHIICKKNSTLNYINIY